jgi:hypothetical protein
VPAFDLDLMLLPQVPLAALPATTALPRIGGGLDDAFWREGASASRAAPAGLCYGEIPPDAVPETVLAVLRGLPE